MVIMIKLELIVLSYPVLLQVILEKIGAQELLKLLQVQKLMEQIMKVIHLMVQIIQDVLGILEVEVLAT
mgnify:CR=1 FL=1